MRKEISEKIKEFVDSLPEERREHWDNFGGGWYSFVVIKKDKLEKMLEDLVEEIEELKEEK